jgi:hypothetical protein
VIGDGGGGLAGRIVSLLGRGGSLLELAMAIEKGCVVQKILVMLDLPTLNERVLR